jgi:hypothetical protein
LLGVLLVGVIGAPVLWLVTLQTGYVLAYQACDDRSSSWVIVPTVAAIIIAMIVTGVSYLSRQRANRERVPLPFIGWLALGMAALMVIVLAASAIAPLVLHACD